MILIMITVMEMIVIMMISLSIAKHLLFFPRPWPRWWDRMKTTVQWNFIYLSKCQENSPEQGRNWSNLHKTVDNWTKPLKIYKPWCPCQHLYLKGTVQFLSDPDHRPHEELSCLLFYDRSKNMNKIWIKVNKNIEYNENAWLIISCQYLPANCD